MRRQDAVLRRRLRWMMANPTSYLTNFLYNCFNDFTKIRLVTGHKLWKHKMFRNSSHVSNKDGVKK